MHRQDIFDGYCGDAFDGAAPLVILLGANLDLLRLLERLRDLLHSLGLLLSLTSENYELARPVALSIRKCLRSGVQAALLDEARRQLLLRVKVG